MSELAPSLCTKRHVSMAVHTCVLWRQMSVSAFLLCARGIRLHLEEGLGHNKQFYLRAQTYKHTHTHVHTGVHTHVHMDMRRHNWNIPCFDLHSSPRIRSFHMLPNNQSLSACTHGRKPLSPTLSLSAKKGTPTRSVSHPLS